MFNKIKSCLLSFIKNDETNYYRERAQQVKDKLDQEATIIAENNYLLYYDYVISQIEKTCENGKFETIFHYGDLFQKGALQYSYDKFSLVEEKILEFTINDLEKLGLKIKVYHHTFSVCWL